MTTSVQSLGFLVGLVMAVKTWIESASSLSLLNYIFVGFVLLLIAIAFEIVHVQGMIHEYRRNRLIRRLTDFRRSR
jgi:hypothetical protein